MSLGLRSGANTAGSGTARALFILAAYYAVLVTLVAFFWSRSEILRASFSFSRFEGADVVLDGLGGLPMSGIGLSGVPGSGLWIALISVAGVLATMIPVAWSYILIKRRGDYSQSVVHTMIILPIAISGLVLIVQHSLPLAFSLAGIVAGVRFRTTLKDVKDGTYVFMAIGVGLACGVQALGVAAVISISFNLVNLVLWKTDFGNIYSDQDSRTGGLALGDILAGPGSGRTAMSIGDKRLIDALEPADLKAVAERLANLGAHLDSEVATPKERKAYSILIVHSDKPAQAQRAIQGELNEMAARWRLAEIIPGPSGHSVFEYLVRLRPGFLSGDVLEAVRRAGGDSVQAAEIRSLTGPTDQ